MATGGKFPVFSFKLDMRLFEQLMSIPIRNSKEK